MIDKAADSRQLGVLAPRRQLLLSQIPGLRYHQILAKLTAICMKAAANWTLHEGMLHIDWRSYGQYTLTCVGETLWEGSAVRMAFVPSALTWSRWGGR